MMDNSKYELKKNKENVYLVWKSGWREPVEERLAWTSVAIYLFEHLNNNQCLFIWVSKTRLERKHLTTAGNMKSNSISFWSEDRRRKLNLTRSSRRRKPTNLTKTTYGLLWKELFNHGQNESEAHFALMEDQGKRSNQNLTKDITLIWRLWRAN